ncbi:MAG TPA: NAD(P)-dependent oxidoreductase, partial [Bdellovibrionales bacterium]|nr:NAD(P)-dependent oxidoreductase [Bdellovibrionales bacterium]
MKIAVFDIHKFERPVFDGVNRDYNFDLQYFETRLNASTAPAARGFEVVCSFVNDQLDEPALAALKAGGTRLIALRSAGFNHVDLAAASKLGLRIVRVPAYSPYAVGEHAVALMLTLNRKIHRSYARVRELNFSLDGLVGFDLHQKTVGLIGTGKIGRVVANIMRGFGCHVLAYDLKKDPELGFVEYTSLDSLYARSDIISLHVPLTPQTSHLLDASALAKTK